MASRHKSHHSKAGSTRIIGSHGRATDNTAEFHATFSKQFLQRYADLFQALAAPVQHVALLNGFTTVNDCEEMGITDRVLQSGPINCLKFPQQPLAYPPPPQCPYTQLKQFYYLDLASLLPPLLLDVQPHHTVLDMCAAPGGKSLVLAMQLLLGVGSMSVLTGAAGADASAECGLTADLLQQLQVTGQPCDAQQQQQQQEVVQQLPSPPAAAEAVEHAEQHPQQQQTADTLQHLQHPNAEAQAADTGDAAAAAAVDGDDGAGSSLAGSISSDAAEDGGGGSHNPGGTTSSSSSSSTGRLVCNELDPVRRGRLQSVLRDYIPGPLRRRVRVTGNDAAKHWARFEVAMYDRILLDAPCSSERHVVQAALEAGGVVSSSSWSRDHCNQLAALQLKLLLAGLKALKPGGRLVYSTCSLADAENDAVVQQAVKQSQSSVRLVPLEDWALVSREQVMQLTGSEATGQGGMICLPDKMGWGPIYLALLEKANDSK